MDEPGRSQIDIAEEIYLESELDAKYRKPKRGLKERAQKKLRKECSCSGERFKSFMNSRFPIATWLPKYNVKTDLLGDIAAGLTVGVVHIPQGLAYALLATLPPVAGLYVSLFPVLLYPIFGTSRHVSMGTFAILSILIRGVLEQRVPENYCGEESKLTEASTAGMISTAFPYMGSNITNTPPTYHSPCLELYEERKLEMATALSVCVGLLQVLMHVFHLGIVTVFLSESLLGGFLCGSSILVITSQIPKLFGITISSHHGPLALVYTYIDIFRNIVNLNASTCAISASCTLFLIIGKGINHRFRKKLKVPIPWELCIVIISTTLSYLISFEEEQDVEVVGGIQTGIVTSVPRGSDVATLFVESVPLAVVTFAVEISLCQVFATKHAYQIDSNQELLALGMCNIFGAFFSCFPSAASLSRSVIYEEVGAKTQLGAYLSSVVVLAVLLWIGPLFQHLPQAALAVIIIVNIKSVAMMWRQVKPLWKISRLDALTWIIAWLSVVLLGVAMGLLVGVCFSILTVLLRTRNASGITLYQVSQTGAYRDSKKYEGTPPHDRIFVYHFTGPLYFATKDRFVDHLATRIGFDAVRECARKKTAVAKLKHNRKVTNKDDSLIPLKKREDTLKAAINGAKTTQTRQSYSHSETEETSTISYTRNTNKYSYVIIDMAQCPFMDSDGSKAISELFDAFKGLDVNLLLSSCSEEVRRSLRGSRKDQEPAVYISLQSAIEFAKERASIPSIELRNGEPTRIMDDSNV